MKKGKVRDPSYDLLLKLDAAQKETLSQHRRIIKCPYCQHPAIIVFDDTRGHVQAKCKCCGKETIFTFS